jgi:predicted nuclease of predicted toxin-antitoxin system
MKLLLDQNISRKLVKKLEGLFLGSNHVYLLGLHEASDEEVWNYARDNGFTIVTQDSDFNERSLVYGYPPKVIWLRTGNVSTQNIKQLLKKHHKDILLFEKDKTLGCLQIY